MRENRTVPFRDTSIKVSRNYYGHQYICMSDVCEIIKQREILKDGAILNLCPSALKMTFRRNGREYWAIRPSDMHTIIQLVRRESILPRDLIDELEEFGNKIFEIEAAETQAQHHVDTTVKFNEDMPVTFRRIGDKLMVNATQITQPYGHFPSDWLRVAATDNLRRRLAQNNITDRYEFQILTSRGRGIGATWIEAPLLTALARWVDPDPDSALVKWCDEQLVIFEDKYKQRLQKRRQPKTINIPCLSKPMPEDINTANKMIDELRGIVREYAPKAAFYDDFIENRDWFKSTHIAEELNISSRHMHKFLMEEGICKYQKKQWVVLPAYRSWQCDVPYTWENAQGKMFTFGSVKRWTHIGRESIIELWNKKHPEFA